MCIIIASVQPSFHSDTAISDGFILPVLHANNKSKNQLSTYFIYIRNIKVYQITPIITILFQSVEEKT